MHAALADHRDRCLRRRWRSWRRRRRRLRRFARASTRSRRAASGVVEVRRDMHRNPELGFREKRTAGARRRQAARAEVRRGAHGRRHDGRRRRAEGRPARAGRRHPRRHGRAAGARADRRAVQVHRARTSSTPAGTTGTRRWRSAWPRSSAGCAPSCRARWSSCSSRPRRAIRTAGRPARGACSRTGRSRTRRRRRSSACTCMPEIRVGQIGYVSGAAMASSDRFSIKIIGKSDARRDAAHGHRSGARSPREIVIGASDDPEPPDRRADADRRERRDDQRRQPLQHHRRQASR